MLDLLLLAASLLPIGGDPMISATPHVVHGEVYAVCHYQSGRTTVMSRDGGETIVLGGLRSGEPATPRQEITTSWTDEQGSEHEVVTPIPGRTDGSRRAAVERHRAAVQLMQEAFPPRKSDQRHAILIHSSAPIRLLA